MDVFYFRVVRGWELFTYLDRKGPLLYNPKGCGEDNESNN